MDVTSSDKVMETLKKLYKKTLLPLEQHIAFPASPLTDVDFDALPLVLVVGHYSTGKTTFIRHMLGRDFPSQRVGPEPTTDRFTGIVASDDAAEDVVPGLVAVHDPTFPFRVLDQLGDAFLSRFVVARSNAPLARRVVFLDTPGVSQRSNVVDVARCLARRADKVVVLFDATKMVLCDEIRNVIEAYADYDEKLVFVLNKCDSLKYHQLMRVYGTLMWSLSKVLRSPVTRRVFMGSFWDRPFLYNTCRPLLEADERDLVAEIENLPESAAMRKLDAFMDRARELQVYASAASVMRPRHLWARRPGLADAFAQLRRLLPHVPPADFPDLGAVRRNRNLRKPRSGLVSALDAMLAHDVPNLVASMQPSPCPSLAASPRGRGSDCSTYASSICTLTDGDWKPESVATVPYGASENNEATCGDDTQNTLNTDSASIPICSTSSDRHEPHNSDFCRFVDGMDLSDINYDMLRKSSHGDTASESTVGIDCTGFNTSPSISRRSVVGEFDQHQQPTSWQEKRSQEEISNVNEHLQRGNEELSSSRAGVNGDTGDDEVGPERGSLMSVGQTMHNKSI